MPTTANTRLYAMYVIGKVESDHDWTGVYRVDPITIGMMQNYGQNASNLLRMCKSGDPDGYAIFSSAAPQLVDDVDAHGDSWDWWTSRYLTDAEAYAWVEMAKRQENHAIQQQKWYQDFDAYTPKLEALGFSLDRPQTFVYAMCMYHQSPKRAGEVARVASGTATLATLHACCLNNRILGRYTNRYNTAFSMLNSWDGESAPPDFGQVKDLEMGGDTATQGQPSSAISYIQEYNNYLIAYGTGGFQNGLVFVKSAPNLYTPSENVSGAVNPGSQTGSGSASGSEGQQAVVDLYKSWEGRFAYGQGGGRLDPLASGYGDCSSTIWRAYQDACGIDVGTWTGSMIDKGTRIGTGQGATLPLGSMQLGDLVIFWRGSRDNSKHVEMYTGYNELYGHGGGSNGTVKGPTRKADANAYCASRGNDNWDVKRYL